MYYKFEVPVSLSQKATIKIIEKIGILDSFYLKTSYFKFELLKFSFKYCSAFYVFGALPLP